LRNIGSFLKKSALIATMAAGTLQAQEPANTATLAVPGTSNGSDSSDAKNAPAIEVPVKDENWNWHVQNTDVVQYHPNFSAAYSGQNSLQNTADIKETVSLDLTVGTRLWKGAELYADGLMYQGFGFNNALGVAGFPNGEAFRVGTNVPAFALTRLFIRQTIGFGGEQEDVPDDETHLAGKEDVSRLTLTVGKISAKDIFDNNAYANDPRTQFMNWSLMANGAWDYAADALGFITGVTAELNQRDWTLRYGFLQVPHRQNGLEEDPSYLKAWQQVTELERRYTLNGHPGTIRGLAYLTHADMGNYSDALISPDPTVIVNKYDYKYGVGLNMDQEIIKDVGAFMRLGWNDGHTQTWSFTDVDRTASTGLSVKGSFWGRPDDTYGLAGVVNGLSKSHEEFIAAGGYGITIGDGKLNYGTEDIMESYYDCKVWKEVHLAFDYQFINNPAYNKDRGPVSVFGARLHWEF
jgi:high affinity Mn2+ porin